MLTDARHRLTAAVSAFAAFAACWGSAKTATPLAVAPEPANAPPPAAAPAGTVLPFPGAPEGVVVDDGGVVAVSVRNPDGVVLFDLATPRQRPFVALGGSARHLELGGPNGPLLVPDESDDRLVEVGMPSGTVLASFPVGRQPHDAAQAGRRVFVGDELANTVHVIDPDGATRVVAAPLQPGGLAASSDGSVVVVVGVRGRRITAYRNDGSIVGSSNCGAGPTHVVAGSGGLFWVVDTDGGAILGFRVGRRGPRQVARFVVGGRPYGVTFDGPRQTLWVTLTATNRLVGLRLRGATVAARLGYPTVRQPNTVAVDPRTGTIVVTGATPDGTLELIR